MQRIFWSHSIALLHQYTNTFCNKANDPKSQNIPDVPDFWLANKIFRNNLYGYAFMQYHISSLTSALLHIITNHWFIHLLYIFRVMNAVRMWQENIILQYNSGVTEGVYWVPSSREKLPFLKENKNEIFRLVFPYFNSWPATETCYYVSILTGYQNNS